MKKTLRNINFRHLLSTFDFRLSTLNFRLSTLLILALLQVSCKTENETILSNIAQVTGFGIVNSKYPALGKAYFIVEELSDTGVIRMRENDSIAYGTPLDSVVPMFRYYTTPAGVMMYLSDTTLTITGKDTLNFNHRPIKICVYSQDQSVTKWYRIEAYVHQMDPDLFVWHPYAQNLYQGMHGEQYAFCTENTFYYYINDGFKTLLKTSGDAKQWLNQPLSGLPNDCHVRQIITNDDATMFYYAQSGRFYTSNDGIQWQNTSYSTDYVVETMLPCFNEHVLSIISRNNSYTLGEWDEDSQSFTPVAGVFDGDTLPSDFPLYGYAHTTFNNIGQHHHMLLNGGYNRRGQIVSSQWLFEYNYVYGTYAIAQIRGHKSNPVIADAAMIYYGDRIILYGGVDAERQLIDSVYYSVDEGMHWLAYTDTAHYPVPQTLKARAKQSVFTRNNDIYIIGGEDYSTTYSDVYQGRLTSIDWPAIGN